MDPDTVANPGEWVGGEAAKHPPADESRDRPA